MNYEISKNKIRILDKSEFNSQDILDCGQVFRASMISQDEWEVRVLDKQAKIKEDSDGYTIELSSDPEFFVSYFDLDRDYSKIKEELKKDAVIKMAIPFGEGIRLLNAPFFETSISFIISANNNIKRIKLILNRLCETIGEKKIGYYSFPTKEKLLKTDVEFWKKIGAGYRANYLPRAIEELTKLDKDDFLKLSTKDARKKLIAIPGIGPKVADCILLFSLARFDVFPVDVWIEKSYHKFFESGIKSRDKMSDALVAKFGDLSGFAQQYVYNYRNHFSD